MCSAASPGRASDDAHIVASRVQPRSGSRPFHRGARGSLNRVRERVPNRVLPLLRFLCSHARASLPILSRAPKRDHPTGKGASTQTQPLASETGQYQKLNEAANSGGHRLRSESYGHAGKRHSDCGGVGPSWPRETLPPKEAKLKPIEVAGQSPSPSRKPTRAVRKRRGAVRFSSRKVTERNGDQQHYQAGHRKRGPT
jgi:hypothetical protein